MNLEAEGITQQLIGYVAYIKTLGLISNMKEKGGKKEEREKGKKDLTLL